MKRILLAIAFTCNVLLAFGQADSAVIRIQNCLRNIYAFNQAYPQEKVYLHMDNRSYFVGDTIWFKAYVVNASTLHPTQLSGVLYVELLDENGIEIQHKKLKINGGTCYGEFPIEENYRTGYYEIRAYTRNMLNFGNIDRKHISGTTLVMQPAVVENYNEVAKNKLSSSQNDKNHSSSLLAPYNMCSFSRVFPVYKHPEVKGDYQRVMEFYPKHTGLAFPQEINHEFHPNNLKTTFYPEGGTLVVGVPSIIAFEATDQWGRKCDIEGYIINEEGTKITAFKNCWPWPWYFFTMSRTREKVLCTRNMQRRRV